jgi:hypothetical protein
MLKTVTGMLTPHFRIRGCCVGGGGPQPPERPTPLRCNNLELPIGELQFVARVLRIVEENRVQHLLRRQRWGEITISRQG